MTERSESARVGVEARLHLLFPDAAHFIVRNPLLTDTRQKSDELRDGFYGRFGLIAMRGVAAARK